VFGEPSPSLSAIGARLSFSSSGCLNFAFKCPLMSSMTKALYFCAGAALVLAVWGAVYHFGRPMGAVHHLRGPMGWYLMTPVPKETFGTPQAELNEKLPLSQWATSRSYQTAQECEQARISAMVAFQSDVSSPDHSRRLTAQSAMHSTCIASDDPRLKGK